MPDRVQVKLLVLGKLRHNSRKKVLIPNMFQSMQGTGLEGKYDVLENQEHLFAEQAKRLERLRER